MHIFDGSWNSETTSGYNWNYLFQTGRLELTGLYIFQHRDYDPQTGRWIEQDPAGYVDGSNLYQFVDSNPVTKVDPMGLYDGSFVGSSGGGTGLPQPGPGQTVIHLGPGGGVEVGPPLPAPAPGNGSGRRMNPLSVGVGPIPSGGGWKNVCALSHDQKRKLKIYICVMEKAGLITPGEALEMGEYIVPSFDGHEWIFLADGPKNVWGETNVGWNFPNIVLNRNIFNDPIVGPSVFYHEYIHFDYDNGGIFGAIINRWWDIAEGIGWDSLSGPAKGGNRVLQGLFKISPANLKKLYQECSSSIPD